MSTNLRTISYLLNSHSIFQVWYLRVPCAKLVSTKKVIGREDECNHLTIGNSMWLFHRVPGDYRFYIFRFDFAGRGAFPYRHWNQ
jgi:hypothetical protein